MGDAEKEGARRDARVSYAGEISRRHYCQIRFFQDVVPRVNLAQWVQRDIHDRVRTGEVSVRSIFWAAEVEYIRTIGGQVLRNIGYGVQGLMGLSGPEIRGNPDLSQVKIADFVRRRIKRRTQIFDTGRPRDRKKGIGTGRHDEASICR